LEFIKAQGLSILHKQNHPRKNLPQQRSPPPSKIDALAAQVAKLSKLIAALESA